MSALAMIGKKPKAAHVFDRDPLDWFVEPSWCTAALLGAERFVGPIWDPACGGGNIVRTCIEAGLPACGSDILNRTGGAEWFTWEQDFLEGRSSGVNIITNPPFFRAKGTEAFVRKALGIATSKVAVFADVKFLASGRRARGLFADHPPTRIWQLADRPSCPPGAYLAAGNKAQGGTADWCWIVWAMTEPRAETRFGWLQKPRSEA